MPAKFALIGTGWRAGFYVKLAKTLPERFEMTGVVCHSSAGRDKATGVWHAHLYNELEDLLRDRPDYVIASVPGKAVEEIAVFCAGHDLPVLFETYCSESVQAMKDLYGRVGGARIQLAEQYPFQPMHQARIVTAKSGILGRVYQVKTSFIQNYHTLAVMRRLLQVGMELPVVYGYQRENQRAMGPTREGDPKEDGIETASEEMFLLDYGDRTALGDYESMQQRSWIRHPEMVVRGERGEIKDDQVTYLKDYLTPITYPLLRSQAGVDGNLEGHYLRGIQGNGEWVYRNPYIPARLLDDEIAVGACMDAMADYAKGGPAFYPLEEAFQDHYVCLLIREAARSGHPIYACSQVWQKGT